MPFRDEYPLNPVDEEGEEPEELPWDDREPDVKDLEYLGDELEADTIRELVQEQVGVWRRVPDLVLEVEGRKGYNARSPATFRGYYQVSPEVSNGLPRIYVDCASGELVSASFIRTPPIPEDDVQEAVLDVLEANGDTMRREAIREDLSPPYGEEAVDAAISALYRDGLMDTDTYGAVAVPRPDPEPASDHLVEYMAEHYPERLDAERTVTMLAGRAAEPHSSVYDPEKQEAWRERVRDWLDLGPVFTRD